MKAWSRRGFLLSAAGSAFAGAFAGSLGLRPGSAFGQSAWPTRPVRFIVPLAPGGALDFVARLVGEGVSRDLGQQVVVDNRSGAGGTIGIEAAVRSAPDGYTVLITNDNVASAPHVQQLPKDYTQDLVPVSQLIRQTAVLAVHPSLGAETLEALLAHARQNPGLGVATSGVGSNQHVLLEAFAKAAHLKLTHVPYRGAGQAISQLIAGHTQVAWLGPAAVLPHAQAGALRIAAQSSRKRSVVLPDTPTLVESGIDVVSEPWHGAFVPTGTPDEIVIRLNAAFDKALSDPAVREKLEASAAEAVGGAPDVLAAQYREDAQTYGRLVKELGIVAK